MGLHPQFLNILQCVCAFVVLMMQHVQVVAAPTGSGKTGILELAILRLLSKCLDGKQLLSQSHGSLKTIYLAPSKALVQVIFHCHFL